MKNFITLSVLMAMAAGLNAQSHTVRDEIHANLKRNTDRLRLELKRESDQRMSPKRAAAQQRLAMTNDGPVYKERLDSIVSVNDSKKAFTYDDHGFMLTQESFAWELDAWQPKTLQRFTYDDEGSQTSEIVYAYDGSAYQPQEAGYHSYLDEERHRVISGFATWNVAHQDWCFEWMSVSDLDNQGREIAYTLYSAWDYDKWQPTNAYERYEVAYQDDGVVVTTWLRDEGIGLVPYARRRARNDEEHHYAMMSENLVFVGGLWFTMEHDEELREYYGEEEWAYHQTYYEHLQTYSLDGKWDTGIKWTKRFDDHHSEVCSEEYYWNSIKGKWQGNSLVEVTYKYFPGEWGDEAVATRSVTLSGWDEACGTWAQGYLSETDVDDHREWILNSTATWSAQTKEWDYLYREKMDRAYDEQGRPTLVEQASWNIDTQEWGHPFFSTTYEYADDGLMTATQFDVWDSSLQQWQSGWKTLTRVDDHGMLTYEESNRWDASLQKFIPNHHKEARYIYDPDSQEGFMSIGYAEVFMLDLQDWSEELGTWNYGEKKETSYDEKYRLVHETIYRWLPSSQDFYKSDVLQQAFDADDLMTEYQVDSYSDDGDPSFEYHEKWSARYDANGNNVESCAYEYDHAKAGYWMTSRKQYEYDLTTSAYDVMGLGALHYTDDKPLSYKCQTFSITGEEVSHEERYFYYSGLHTEGEGIQQAMAPVMVDVMDGRLTVSSESPADLTVSSLDGRLMAAVRQVRTFTLQLPSGVYVVTVNGESRKVSI